MPTHSPFLPCGLPEISRIDAIAVEAAITPRTKAIVPVHYAGLAQRITVMRLHGMSRDAFDRFIAKVPSWCCEIAAPVCKINLTGIAAALSIQALHPAPAFQARSRAVSAPASRG